MASSSRFWEEFGNPGGYSLLVDKLPIRNRMQRVVNREAFRVYKELFDSLIGAGSGGAASATHKRIAHVNTVTGIGALGGSRAIDTITDISRNTTAGDITELKEMVVNVKPRPATYPRDLSGNGGPAF